MIVPNIYCRKTNDPIRLGESVEVYKKGTFEFLAWGWIEFNKEDGFYFRYDWHSKVLWGTEEIIHLENYDYEKN